MVLFQTLQARIMNLEVRVNIVSDCAKHAKNRVAKEVWAIVAVDSPSNPIPKGFWEEKLRPGFGFLDWLPKGDVKQVRLIKSEPDYKANANANAKKSVDETKEQYALIAKLDAVKLKAQSALIAQLCKELTTERKKNRILEQKLDDVYKTMFGAAKYDEQLDMVNISQLLNLDDLLSD
jgi:hypothetical protein